MGGHGEIRRFKEQDKQFLDLMSDEAEVEKIENETKRQIDLANNIGVYLPLDDPFELLLQPDKTWTILTLDIEHLLIPDKDISTESESDKIARKEANNDCLDIFMQSLKNITEDFKKHIL